MAKDYDDLVEEFGVEYLWESNPDYAPNPMDEFNDLVQFDPLEAITRAFYGGRYGFKNDSFNPNDEYFAFNGYANLISIKDYDLTDYLKDGIDEPYFMEWLADNGYIDEE